MSADNNNKGIEIKTVNDTLLDKKQQWKKPPASQKEDKSKDKDKDVPAILRLTPLNKYNILSTNNVINNERFEIKDLFVKDKSTGFIIWTHIDVTLKGGQQSLRFNIDSRYEGNGDMKFYVDDGSAWFLVDTDGEVVHPGDIIVVRKGQYHKIFNNSASKAFVYSIQFAGFLNLRRYLQIENATVTIEDQEKEK